MGGATCDIISNGRTMYRYNPYMKSGSCKLYVDDLSTSSRGPSSGTTTPRPCDSQRPAPFYTFLDATPPPSPVLKPVPEKSDMKRIFLGQLPFCVTDDQLNYAIGIATCGLMLHHVERIVNWKKGRSPTGCVHAYCRHEDVDTILSAHLRIRFDEEGVWFARNEAEAEALKKYVPAVASPVAIDASNSVVPSAMPSGLVTIEVARSTYVPDAQLTVVGFAGRRRKAVLKE